MQDSNEYKYISVVFKDKDTGEFRGRGYLYRTKRNLVENQIIEFDTNYGHSIVSVAEPNISKEEAARRASEIGYELEELKEI